MAGRKIRDRAKTPETAAFVERRRAGIERVEIDARAAALLHRRSRARQQGATKAAAARALGSAANNCMALRYGTEYWRTCGAKQ